MIIRAFRTAAFLLAALPLSAAAAPKHVVRAPVAYAAPATTTPAGPLRTGPFDAVLPSGRIVTPLGRSALVGMNALGVALSPDGRYAIVTCDDERQSATASRTDPRIFGGFSLAVVDTATMRVVDTYRRSAEDMAFWLGVAALRDPRDPANTLVLASGGPSNDVFAFDLDANGHLTPDRTRFYIATPGPIDPAYADEGRSYPGAITVSADGRRAYVVNEAGGTVSAIDTATRALSGPPARVGIFPFGVAVTGDHLYVTSEGMMRYGVLPAPVAAPPFRTPPADPRASSLSAVALAAGGDVAAAPGETLAPPLPLDPPADGIRTVGGAHPTAIVASPDGAFAYVAMTNVDRIATVALGATPHVVGGTEMRLFDKGPYGTQPAALALSRDGTRLYAALAGLNAVAVVDTRDPVHPHRLGLIPTGWYPTALALGDDDRTLYIVNTKGFGHEAGFTGDPRTDADANAVWSTLQRVDLTHIRLADATRAALNNARRVTTPATLPSAITNVVVILEENKSFDAMLGDLGFGPADPHYVSFGATVTPNLHALARRFALFGNYFADAEESDAGHQFFAGGIATAYSERTLFAKNGRRPLVNKNEDPEDYPRAGYIFNLLARKNITFRDYGDLIRVAGYDEGQARDPKTDDPSFAGVDDRNAPTSGLGGRYALDVPAPAVLEGNVDLNYPGWNLRIRDERRAHEFIRDYDALVKAGRQPRYTYIWLPADHGGEGRDIPPLAEEVADGDRALGAIVAYLSHLPSWKHTAIFVTPDDAQSSRDHVDEYRSYALLISPYAKQHFVGMRHTSTVSVLKTTLELFHAGSLSLGDLVATDLADGFTSTPHVAPYTALPVATQTASAEGARIATLLERLDQSRPDADGPRAARIIELSRRADALAAAPHGAGYAAAQAALYASAAAVAAPPGFAGRWGEPTP